MIVKQSPLRKRLTFCLPQLSWPLNFLSSLKYFDASVSFGMGPICNRYVSLKPGFHIVVSGASVVSVVRKKFIGQIQLYGNLPYKCSIQQKREIQLVVRERMNSIFPMNFFRSTYTTDTTIWKPGLNLQLMDLWLEPWNLFFSFLLAQLLSSFSYSFTCQCRAVPR